MAIAVSPLDRLPDRAVVGVLVAECGPEGRIEAAAGPDVTQGYKAALLAERPPPPLPLLRLVLATLAGSVPARAYAWARSILWPPGLGTLLSLYVAHALEPRRAAVLAAPAFFMAHAATYATSREARLAAGVRDALAAVALERGSPTPPPPPGAGPRGLPIRGPRQPGLGEPGGRRGRGGGPGR